MNFNGFDFDTKIKNELNSFDSSAHLPHAVIIESLDNHAAMELARFLSMYAVCAADEKPCGVCKQCVNAKNGQHADINYMQLEKGSDGKMRKQYSIEQIRQLAADATIVPNDAAAKVYIIDRADERMNIYAQNAFLKLAEEPPENVYFLLVCKNSKALLDTILSRFTILRVKGGFEYGEKTLSQAREIAMGALDISEYRLLKALNPMTEKNGREQALQTLDALCAIFRDAVALLSGGEPYTDAETARALAAKFTRKRLIEAKELCDSAAVKINQNVNIKLLTVWLCGELRRITWQK